MQIVLVIIGIILIVYNYKSIKHDKASNKEVSFENILKDRNNNIDDYGIELGRLRKDIAESLTELQEDILEIKTKLNMTTENTNLYENKENEQNNEDEKDSENDVSDSYEETETSFSENESLSESESISESEYLIKAGSEDDVISDIDFSNSAGSIELNKVEEIGRLLKEGATEDEICRTLSVSKGEILLVKDLFRK